MKKLPIGIQDFKKIREGDYIYVDKTRLIYDIINNGTYYFLSRPRRFGKSLLVSTMYYLFKGEKKLFKGLYIYDKWKFEEYPIIRLDISQVNTESKETIDYGLKIKLKEIYEKYDIEFHEDYLTSMLFDNLIRKLYEKYGKQVVVLIDEYDRGILDHIDEEDIQEIREYFRNFYGILKGADPYLKFVFLTGISKFSKMSIFSQLNNLEDITLNDNYAVICGFTFEEIKRHFKEHIEELAKKHKISYEEALDRIRYWYNGYKFGEECDRVINPFSLLKCLKERKFKNYWIESGTPYFIVKYLKRNDVYDLEYFDRILVDKDFLVPYEIENSPPEGFLFQAGYLTILDVTEDYYVLGFPNVEVKNSLSKLVLSVGYEMNSQISLYIKENVKYGLLENDSEKLKNGLNTLFANISYNLFDSKEKYYHSLIYTALLMCGLNARNEDPNNLGRSDIIVEYFDNRVWILEIKLDKPIDEAIKQIKEKKYYNKFVGKKVYLVGISIDSKERCVKEVKFV